MCTWSFIENVRHSKGVVVDVPIDIIVLKQLNIVDAVVPQPFDISSN